MQVVDENVRVGFVFDDPVVQHCCHGVGGGVGSTASAARGGLAVVVVIVVVGWRGPAGRFPLVVGVEPEVVAVTERDLRQVVHFVHWN